MQRPLYLLFVVLFVYLFGAITISSAQDTIPVRVVIEKVESLDGGIDPFSAADFYPIVTIDGATFGGTILTVSNGNEISPNWQFARQVADTATSVNVSIALWDNDSGLTGADDQIDIQPGSGRQLDLTVNIDPCSFSGDDSGDCWVTETVQGDQNDNARIRYRIEVGDPPLQAELTLTIERVISQDGGIDTFSQADFYPIVRIDGSEYGSEGMNISNDDDITPNWQFTKLIPLSVGVADIDIQIWDSDGGLNFGDDQIDVSPNAGRTLDFFVELVPCNIGGYIGDGDLIFGANCNETIIQSGNQNDDAQIHFRIEVVPPPSIEGLNVRCLHDPLWSQGGAVTITAEALDDDLNPLSFTTGTEVQIWLNDTVTPVATDTNVNTLDHTFNPVVGQFSYGCQIITNDVTIWSGWRAVQVGPSPTQAVPVIFTRDPGSAIDIVFLPDVSTYTGSNDATFLDDIHDTIRDAYYGELLFLANQHTINFWIAQDLADYEFSDDSCNFTVPANWDTSYAFAEAGSIVHSDPERDCARFSLRIFSGTAGDDRVFLHETGHQPFGLADEYCCDGGYFQTDPYPNIYEALGLCQADAANVLGEFGTCRNFTDEDGNTWYTSDPANDDLMVDNLTPRPLDIRRIEWLFNNCRSANC